MLKWKFVSDLINYISFHYIYTVYLRMVCRRCSGSRLCTHQFATISYAQFPVSPLSLCRGFELWIASSPSVNRLAFAWVHSMRWNVFGSAQWTKSGQWSSLALNEAHITHNAHADLNFSWNISTSTYARIVHISKYIYSPWSTNFTAQLAKCK